MNKKRLLIWMITLTAMAGLINALAICYYGYTVSHVTGLVSNFAINIYNGNWQLAWIFLSVILSFLVGAILSGFITAERAFYLHKRYGIIILVIGALLGLGVFLLQNDSKNLVRLFAFLMGLQNGMVVSFRGVVVRMTHMSGNLTDFGVFLGYKLRGKMKEEAITGIIPGCCILSFTAGGILGLWLYSLVDVNAFYISAVIYLILGSVYFVLQRTCIDKDFNGIPDVLEGHVK